MYVPQACRGYAEAQGCGSRIPLLDCNETGVHETFAKTHCPFMCGLDCAGDPLQIDPKTGFVGTLVDATGHTLFNATSDTSIEGPSDPHYHHASAAVIAVLAIIVLVLGAAFWQYGRNTSRQQMVLARPSAVNNPMYDTMLTTSPADSSVASPAASERCSKCNAKTQFCVCTVRRVSLKKPANAGAAGAGNDAGYVVPDHLSDLTGNASASATYEEIADDATYANA